MSWLVSTSLRLRIAVLALSCLLIVFGIRTLRTTPLDVFPEFAPPLVEIQTEAPGISTEEVESMITMPLENALNGTPWKKIIRSQIGARPVVGRADFRGRHRPDPRPAARAGTPGDRSQPPAGHCPPAGDSLAALVHQPGDEDRHHVDKSSRRWR